MAKIKKGILGPLSGKLGPVIGGTWKTISYLRIAPPKSNKSKRTPAQIATQEKMRFINKFLVPFHPYITVGMKHEAESQTEISAAFSANYHESILGISPNLSVDFGKFIFSKGILPMVKDLAVTLADGFLHITWSFESVPKTSFDDQMIIVAYAHELEETDGFIGGVNRAAKKCALQLSEHFIGKAIDVYVSITSLDRKRIANNVYLGRYISG
ncbi:DUF6266 family protein [Pedobacter insulae]|uniref:Uncharacterized protein n=1 Tax=Pedobacter insulae TaxID=414048 RepID=A0A1I2WLG4_9SPHI|nr:DUF6266 family protein [Pedobacter insulae]SFH00441.1 hypothetical protein SAMN04489864_10439 [Pedobacter insulae]